MTSTLFIIVLIAAVFHAFWNFYARKMSGNLVVFWFSQPGWIAFGQGG